MPHDGTVGEVVDPLSRAVTVIFVVLAIIGIIFAVVCLFLNFILRQRM